MGFPSVFTLKVKYPVNVTVDTVDEATEIASDLKEILDKNGITNSVNVTDEISY
jgi:hypothetical protein